MSILRIKQPDGSWKSVPAIVGEQGERGYTGDPGYTPVRGTDYWTEEDQTDITNQITQEITEQMEVLEALPHGGSKEWLENNGDVNQLYQINGYVWGYIESEGWTKSNRQFRVISSIGAITDHGGVPYLLRNGNNGTVYTYRAESGDVGVPVYSSLPETANDGDIVAVDGKKYKASVTTEEVPNYTDLTKQEGWTWTPDHRTNSSGGLTEQTGVHATDYIHVSVGDIIRIKGLDVRYNIGGYAAVQFFKSDKTFMQSPSMTTLVTSGYVSVDEVDYVIEITAGYSDQELSDTAYQRFCGKLETGYTLDNVIITVNEEITTRIDNVVKWTEIGEYTPPVYGGWYETTETYSVIDSISGTATNGARAVYSVDGFVYIYLNGAAWMELSEYKKSTVIVDKALSENSTNPVQNKVVTAEIKVVEAIAESNRTEINALNTKIAGIESGSQTAEIPSFWKDAVDVCISKIKALQVGRNCITFPFFSDNHQRNGYAGLLIAHIMKECNIPYCFYGGDSISSGTIVDEAEMIAQDKAFDTTMSYIPNGRFCRAVGNHDGYWYDGTNKFYYDRDGVYDLFLREESIAQNKHFGEDGTYYYVDEIASKVRFVVLNTNGIRNTSGGTFDSTQLAWLQNTALKTESGWAVVLICHQPLSNHYHALINNASEVIAAIRASGADIAGCFSGHIHRDRIYTGIATNTSDDSIGAALPFTQVTITSDHTTISYDNATKHTVASDDKSHAIDFITINKGTRTVNITRLGIGSDRSYTY